MLSEKNGAGVIFEEIACSKPTTLWKQTALSMFSWEFCWLDILFLEVILTN